MDKLLQWIPNFFTGMLEVLKEARKEAGGGKKGSLVFWVGMLIFFVFSLLFIAWFSKPAFDNFAEVLGHFNFNIKQVNVTIPSSLWFNLLLAFISTLALFVFMIGFAGIIGAFIGMLANIIFPGFTTYRIDKLFTELIPILKRSHELNPNDKTDQILNDANKLYEGWRKRFPNRITRFLTTKMNREKFDKMKL